MLNIDKIEEFKKTKELMEGYKLETKKEISDSSIELSIDSDFDIYIKNEVKHIYLNLEEGKELFYWLKNIYEGEYKEEK